MTAVDLSPAQLAVLKAAAHAPDVRRPDADLKVGDEVTIAGLGVAAHTASVTAIGPRWITVVSGRGTARFDRGTLHSENTVGAGCSLRTPEQGAYDRRLAAARRRVVSAGLTLNHPRGVGDGLVFAVAALLDLLDEPDAGRALLDTPNPEGKS